MTPFLELMPGSNVVRLLTQPFQYQSHPKLKLKGNPDHGQKLKCPAIMLETFQCDLCKENRSAPRWIIGCLSRKDDKVSLLDVDYLLFGMIRNFARHERWGDPTTYDLDIMIEQGECKVIPIPTIMDFDKSKYPVDLDELKDLSAPSLKDLDAIVAKNYEEVKYAYRAQDYDY